MDIIYLTGICTYIIMRPAISEGPWSSRYKLSEIVSFRFDIVI
jgi:hypothetical protein